MNQSLPAPLDVKLMNLTASVCSCAACCLCWQRGLVGVALSRFFCGAHRGSG
jgi:hypothetical protein